VDTKEHVQALRKIFTGPMSEDEIEILRDIQGMIEFAIRNGLSFAMVVSTLGHDVNGIARHGLSLKDARAHGFVPKVTGYSKYTQDAVGEPDEPDE